MTPDRPRAEFRHPWRLLALAIIGWAMLFAWAFVQDADADDHGIVVTCTTVQVWDHNRLGDVLVEYADGADAEGRFGNAAIPQAKFLFGVERRVSRTQTQPARRDFPDTPPLARHDAENFAHELLRRLIAFAAHGTRVLIFHLRAT